MLIQQLPGKQQTEVALYGQPILHLIFGVICAVVGMNIWRPLPTHAMPEFDADTTAQPVRASVSARGDST